MIKKSLEQIYQNFNVIYLNENNLPHISFKTLNNSKIISIDTYQNENDSSCYFSFCFDCSIILIEITNLSILTSFIMENKDSYFFCISEIIIEYFKVNKIGLNFNFSSKCNTQISNFIDDFKKFNIKISPKLASFINCITGYLILKSYKNSNKNRISHLIKNINLKTPQQEKNRLKFITIDQNNSNSSIVKLSYNIEDCKLYIIKIHTDFTERDKLAEREYNNYQNLKHPFLPQLIEYYPNKDNDYSYLVIEYIDGTTLCDFDLINLNEFEIYNIIFEIMIIIHYIHSKNYILRDLKPDNIKIDKNNTAILIDLDRVIKINDDDDSEFTYDFNHEYVSPEISKGTKFTNKTDIYSLGLIVKKMFIKRYHKFSNKYLKQLEIMCKYCMKKNPDDRPTISQLIRYFYLNILSNNESKNAVEKELIKILQYNFEDQKINDHEGLCTLGIIFQEGIYTDMNMNEAIKYHSLAAEQNNLLSLFNLYILYDSYDENKAIEYLKKGADLGDKFFQYLFAYDLYYYKINVDVNECIKYLKLSAAQNFVNSNHLLGVIYYLNPKMKNIEKAIKYFSIASSYRRENPENNDFYDFYVTFSLPNKQIISNNLFYSEITARFSSNMCLGDIYKDKSSDYYDISKSIYYYSCISKQDIIEYQNYINECNLKKFPEYGIEMLKSMKNDMIHDFINANFFIALYYIKNDIDGCINRLKLLLDFDHYLAPFYLGLIYSTKEFNCINISKAMKYYSLAEKKIDFKPNYLFNLISLFNSSISNNLHQMIKEEKDIVKQIRCIILNNFGNIYYKGEFTQRDMNKAIHFYSQASEYGDSVAQYWLGRIYYDGEYIKDNTEKSIHYFTLSAKSQNKDSQFFLGLIYYKGEKVQKNIEKAVKYFIEAAKNTSQIARFYLGIIYYTGKDIKRDITSSIYYFKEAGNLNDSYAKNNLGIIYKNDKEIKQNIKLSIEYFEEAIRFDNNEAARYNLAHVYFYYDQIENQTNKTIELLIKPELISINYGHQLLCLALIKKCKSISVKSIKEILIKVYPKYDRSITLDIYNEIIKNDLLNENKYNELFEQIEANELLYLDHEIFVLTKDLNINEQLAWNIDIDFYEGFGDNEVISKYIMENPSSIKRNINIKSRKSIIKREKLNSKTRNINIKTNKINNKSTNDSKNSNIYQTKFSKIFNKYDFSS